MNTGSDATVALAFASYMLNPDENAIEAIVEAVSQRPDLLRQMAMTPAQVRRSLIARAPAMRHAKADTAQAQTAALITTLKGKP